MFRRILETEPDYATMILRLALGAMIFPHGAQKMLGIWGGQNLTSLIVGFQKMGIPAYLTILVVIFEFFGGIGLILGFVTRLWALGVGVIMAVAVYMVHWPLWFMNWNGQQKGEGIEFHLLAIAIAIALVLKGGGAYSVDHRIAK